MSEIKQDFKINLENVFISIDFYRKEFYIGGKEKRLFKIINENNISWKVPGDKTWWVFPKHTCQIIMKEYKKYLISKAIKDKLSE